MGMEKGRVWIGKGKRERTGCRDGDDGQEQQDEGVYSRHGGIWVALRLRGWLGNDGARDVAAGPGW